MILDYNKPLDGNGLAIVKQKIQSWLAAKQDKLEGKSTQFVGFNDDNQILLRSFKDILPPGGTSGQILSSTSNGDYGASWINNSASLVSTNNVSDLVNATNVQDTLNQILDVLTRTATYTEYDTDEDTSLNKEANDAITEVGKWHVKKWSDGTVEMALRKTYTIGVTNKYGEIYCNPTSIHVGGVYYPLALKSFFVEYDNIVIPAGQNISIWFGPSGREVSDPLVQSNYLLIMRPTSAEKVSFDVVSYINGKWK